jgi:hypothetical protein
LAWSDSEGIGDTEDMETTLGLRTPNNQGPDDLDGIRAVNEGEPC